MRHNLLASPLVVLILLCTLLVVDNVSGIWTPITDGTPVEISDIYMASSTDGWAVGLGGAILRWNGNNWVAISSPTTVSLSEVDFASPNDGWAVGGSDTIIQWNGAFWTENTVLATDTALWSVSMASSYDGWAGGNGGLLRWDGTDWSRWVDTVSLNHAIYGIDMLNPTDGWAVSPDYGGMILRWDGSNWNEVPCPEDTFPVAIDMVSSTDGWAVGMDSISRWNGNIWTTVSCPTTELLLDINMISSTEGWIVGYNGVILRWNGNNWYSVTSPTTDHLAAVDMISSTEGWIASYSGTFLKWIVESPVADFTFSPSTGEVDQTVSFDASDSSDPDGSITNWDWDFGDGDTDSGETTSHSYDSADTYTVELTVTDDDGATDTITKQITVTPTSPPTNVSPVASFTISPSTQEENKVVSFNATGSSDSDGTVTGYAWDFGDGSSGSGVTTSHSYSSAETYTVELTVTDDDGATDATTKSIIITENESMQGSISISDGATSTGDRTVTLNLTADSSVGVSEMRFSNDNSDWSDWQAFASTATWTLTEGDGTKTVYVQFKDNNGEISTYSDTITLKTQNGETAAFPIEYAIIAAVGISVAIIAVIIYKFLKRSKKPPPPPPVTPVQLRITADPTTIVADGQSKSIITIQLVDKNGNLINAIADTQIKILAGKGKLEKPDIIVPKGKDTEQTAIISSKEYGEVPVTAEAKNLESVTITLNFLKKRYCMHCGATMPSKARSCDNCGKAPPAGVDTKVCHNCKSVIPSVAKFCSECGTGQKEKE